MFEQLTNLPSDPLLGLIEKYRNDPNPNKVDLGVGVYKDESGNTPVLEAVKAAEKTLLDNEQSKAYVGPAGNAQFNELMAQLVFGEEYSSLGARLTGLQTPGGCGALRVLAETLVVAKPKTKVWVSDPTWVNHMPLLGNAGVELDIYPYYDFSHSKLRFDDMISVLSDKAKEGDVLLLHGCCHNPCGADLDQDQWREVVSLCERLGLVPFIDMAYQGFGDDLEQDAFGLRLAAASLPELLLAVSCSKNFGLYRERVGAAFVVSESPIHAQAVDSHMKSITRGIYSMPPSHGASIVAEILGNAALADQWRAELSQMRLRIQSVRKGLSQDLSNKLGSSRFDFIPGEKGMFSFLGITPDQVEPLASNYGIYMAGSSRVNIAGLSSANIGYVSDSIAQVIKG